MNNCLNKQNVKDDQLREAGRSFQEEALKENKRYGDCRVDRGN
jgi:hypothetical protein